METSNPLLKRDGAFSTAWASGESMTLQGVVNKSGILLLLCLASGAFAWTHPELRGPLVLIGLVGGLIACLVGTFKPATSPVAAPAYALLEGLCLGAISQVIEHRYPGIVLNAMLLTFGVLGVMLAAYTTRTIVVTERLMKGVFAATAAVFLVYMVDMLLGFFGHRVPFIHESGPLGIGISLVIVGIAAFNLLLDFAVIEQNVRSGAPRFMEWYCGMALLVTLVWLYLELIRLLSKLRGRD
ncbi:MAG TPA: Bax inhibitor-1/YccA family protein [Candidatus Limnocylindrales bacterium]|nr:Bax inhibitor-1/YccA family protein [Candidatus Limnocylindrales bacterium]